jgi:hypothetical protein
VDLASLPLHLGKHLGIVDRFVAAVEVLLAARNQGDAGFLLHLQQAEGPAPHRYEQRDSPRALDAEGDQERGGNGAERELGTAGERPRFGVHLHPVTFLDEEGHANLEAGLERGGLGDAATRRVAANARLG